MFENEIADGFGEEENHHEGKNNRGDDDLTVAGQTHRSDHRIKGKDHIQNDDLRDDVGKAVPSLRSTFLVGQFHGGMNLLDRFPNQKQATRQQGEVSPGELKPVRSVRPRRLSEFARAAVHR